MELPAADVEFKPEKFEEVKETGPLFHCGLFDAEIVHKIAQVFLPGLASACVDNTTGGLFKSPGSVAVDMRREMVAYLTQRSETFVAESVILDGGPEAEVSEHPYDIISDFVDDFASSKRNIFSRVSGWLLSERREDKIDDFVQEMEINGFWFMERREAVAQTLLKNVDFKNTFHCNLRFNSEEELAGHSPQCKFRTMNCTNEGCNARFCAAHLEHHDHICPFKIIPCEQKCSESIMRREMDKHCITVCPMKLVNCPFYPVGCQFSIPHCRVEQHRLENLHSHLLYVLQVIHKDASVEDLKGRVGQLEESAPPGQLAEARDARMLTYAIKDLEAELGPLIVNTNIKVSEDRTESPNKKEESAQSATQEEGCAESPNKKEEVMASSPNKKEEDMASPNKKEEHLESSTRKEHNESPPGKEECTKSPSKKEESSDSSSEKEEYNSSLTKKEEVMASPDKKEEHLESPTRKEPELTPSEKECTKLHSEKEESSDSSSEKEEYIRSPTKKEEFTESVSAESPSKTENHSDSPTEKEA